MELLILIITGLSVGMVSAFFGIGGGAIMIPVLYSLFPKLDPAAIISISLGTIVLNTALNNWRFHKKGLLPHKRSLLVMLACAAIGALIGAQLLYMLPAATLKKIFGALLLLMSARVAFSKQGVSGTDDFEEKLLPLGTTCFVGAFISSITGLGGGAIFVPFFLGFVKLPLHRVSPYSNVAMMAASFVGLLPHFFVPGNFNMKSELANKAFVGNVNLLFILCLFFGAFFSSKLGVKLHGKIEAKTKRWLLAGLLLVLALKILLF